MSTYANSSYNTRPIKQQMSNKHLVFIICLIFSFVVQFFVNYDSPTHYGFKHIDGAWFLMCGKSMMNGLIPYVDFTDSKGPLLWLFNGIGYLIYPKGYEGLYILFSLYYAFVFYFCYKTAKIGLGCSHNYAILASFAMSVVYFTWCHDEMRCEDLCQLPLIYGIYRLTLAIKNPESSDSAIASLLIGLGIGCCVMIKWNQALLLCLIPASLMILAIAAHLRAMRIFIYNITGIIISLLPWIIYFIIVGNLDAFIDEYFFNTMRTFDDSSSKIWEDIRSSLLSLVTSVRFFGILFTLAPLYIFRNYGWKAWLPTICALLYMLLLTYKGANYYMTGMSSFAIYTVVSFIYIIRYRIPRLSKGLLIAATICIVALNAAYAVRYHMNFKYFNSYKNEEFGLLNDIIAQIPNARILHFDYYEQGLGLTSRTLPACRYWSVQSGGESFSRQNQLEAIYSRKPDFITVQSVEAGNVGSEKEMILEKMGYKYIGSMRDYFGLRCNLFAKKEFGLTPLSSD